MKRMILLFTAALHADAFHSRIPLRNSRAVTIGGGVRLRDFPVGDGNAEKEPWNQFTSGDQEARTPVSEQNLVTPSKSAPLPEPPRNPLVRLAIFMGLALKLAILKIKLAFNHAGTSFIKATGLVIRVNPKAVEKVKNVGDGVTKLLSNKKFTFQLSVLISALVAVRRYLAYSKSLVHELAYSAFLKVVADDPTKIQFLRITPSAFYFKLNGASAMTRPVPIDNSILTRLMESGLDFAAPPTPPNVLGILWTCVYAGFMWKITTRMMQGPQDSGAGQRKEAQLAAAKLSFNDIAGLDEAKLEVAEVCSMLRTPGLFDAVGARLPAGVLMVGPPGTGKTLLARVAASEAGVPFFACSASDFVEVFVGRGPARVRKLFKQAAETAPCIVFIDELDSIGRSRRQGSMNAEMENTLNQLLTSMDGLDTSNNGVIVMAATNRLELLDSALLRAGRFDRIIQCPLPDKSGRKGILKVHTKNLQLSDDIDFDRIAKLTPSMCGADISTLSNEAAIRAARRGSVVVNMNDFESALQTFYKGRGIPMSGVLESFSGALPSWLRKDEAPSPAMG